MIYGGYRKEISGGETYTTNNRMEITAAIKALEALKRPVECLIFTDSTYLYNGATQWLPRWKQNNWRLRSGKPVENRDLWEQLAKLITTHNVKWNWIPGHNHHSYNEEADHLARNAILKVNHNSENSD